MRNTSIVPSFSKGKRDLYEIQTAILWKLIEETVDYDNIYYDICHEPFIRAMKPKAQEDLEEFLAATTLRFIKEYQKRRPDKVPILGLTDGAYDVEIWKLSAPGRVIENDSCIVAGGKTELALPGFVDDLVVRIF